FSVARAAAENKLAVSITTQKEKNGEAPDKAQAEAQAEAAAQEEAQAKASTTEPFQSGAKTASDDIESSKNSVTGTITKGLTITGAACIVRNTSGDIAKANRDIV